MDNKLWQCSECRVMYSRAMNNEPETCESCKGETCADCMAKERIKNKRICISCNLEELSEPLETVHENNKWLQYIPEDKRQEFTRESLIQQAVQQLTGWLERNHNPDITSVISSMGLTIEEWPQIEVAGLTEEQISEVEQYFLDENK